MPSYPPINHQRMNPGELATRAVARVGVTPLLPTNIEGGLVGFFVRRTRSSDATIVFQYIIESDGGPDDFAPGQTLSANITLGPGVTTYGINVLTQALPGPQGERFITCRLVAISACEVDTSFEIANTKIIDEIETGGDWFKSLPYRSNKSFAAGVSYFQNAPFNWKQYETECQPIDGFNGDHFGDAREFISTWERVQGGPLGNSASIVSNGQLSWNTWNTHFSVPFKQAPVNTCWVWFNFTVVPAAYDTFLAGNRSKIWDEINAGTHDQRFTEFGARIATLFASRGISLDYFIGCMCPRPQTSTHYRVFADTKLAFRDAFNRVVGLIRTGAAKPDLRFCMSYSFHKTYEGQDYGSMASWFPSSADVIGMVWHPNSDIRNRTTYDDVITGNANYYGITTEMLNLAVATGKPIAFPEWSPRWQSCPIANDVYNWFHDEVLLPNAHIIVGANIYHNNTFDVNAADAQGAAAAAQWASGVSTFISLFGDGTSLPNAVVSIENTGTAQVTEGNVINFNVRRNSAATQACSVRWTATSSRAAGDLTGEVTGTVTFGANDGIASKTVQVTTTDISGDQGNRTITVTLSAPNNCTLNASASSAARVVIDRVTVASTTLQIYRTPFSRRSGHRRPIGAGAIWQVQGGVSSGNMTNTSTYRANQGPIYSRGDLSPLVEEKTGLTNSGFFGELRLAPGKQSVKAFTYVPTDDPDKIVNNKTVTRANGTTFQTDWPLLDYEGSNVDVPVFDHTDPGEGIFMLYPKNALESAAAVMLQMGRTRNTLPTGATTAGNNEEEWPLNGLDWIIGFNGSGGSGALFPTGVLRGRPFMEAGETGIAVIDHSLHMEITRRNFADENDPTKGNNPITSILLGRDIILPAVARDGSAMNATTAPGTGGFPYGKAYNIGFLPYGGLLAIPEWFQDVRDSTTAAPVTIPGYTGSFALNLTNIGKALFDCLRKYGVRPLDGSWEAAGPDNAYARAGIRHDQTINQGRIGGARLYDLIQTELAKICPPRPAAGASLARWRQNLLFPCAGMCTPGTENGYNAADDSYYFGGGGKRYPDSINTGLF